MTNLSPSTRQHLIPIESSPSLIFEDIQSFELNQIEPNRLPIQRPSMTNGIPNSNKLHLTSITPPRRPHHHHCNKQNINRTNGEIRNGTSYSSLVSAFSSFHSTGHHSLGPQRLHHKVHLQGHPSSLRPLRKILLPALHQSLQADLCNGTSRTR
jgi:hypothetical protein